VRGGQTPLLNNSPAIVLKDGKLAMVFGTPGGETIGQTEFQMLVNVVDFKMPVQQAVEHPRFVLDAKPNFYKPGSEITVTIEKRVPATALKSLEEWGHKLAPTSDFTAARRGMQAIVVDLAKGTMLAGADPAPHGIRRRLVARGHLEHLGNVDASRALRVWMKVSHEKGVLFLAACLVLPSVGGLARKRAKPVEWPSTAAIRRGRNTPRSPRSTRTTVGRLALAWEWQTGEAPRPEFGTTPGAFQNTPLMIDDVVYLSTPYNRVVALDAETGQEKWAFDPRRTKTDRSPAARGSCIEASPRGATATACASS
jgi:hypothetical protein